MKHFHSQMKSVFLCLQVSLTCSVFASWLKNDLWSLKTSFKNRLFATFKWNCKNKNKVVETSKNGALEIAILHLLVKALLRLFLFFFSEMGDKIKLPSHSQFLRIVCLCRTRPRVLLDIFCVFDQPAQTADFFSARFFFFPLLRLFSVTSAAGSRFCWVCGICGRMGGCTCSFLG